MQIERSIAWILQILQSTDVKYENLRLTQKGYVNYGSNILCQKWQDYKKVTYRNFGYQCHVNWYQ